MFPYLKNSLFEYLNSIIHKLCQIVIYSVFIPAYSSNSGCFNGREMTIYNQRDRQKVPQPSVRVEEIPTLREIYNQEYPPYFDFDGMIFHQHALFIILTLK